jgi:hypothetical protein
MKKIFKYLLRIFVGFLGLILIIVIALLCIGYYYGDKAKQIIVTEINKSLTTEVSVKEIELSLFENFPEATIEFFDIQTKEKNSKNNNPLLNAKSLSLLFDIYDIFSGDYTIEKMILRDASVNLIVFDDKSENFNIIKPKEAGKSGSDIINLSKVILKNVIVSFTSISAGQEYLFTINEGYLKGAFSAEKFNLDFNGDLYSTRIRSGKNIFLKDHQMDISLTFDVNKKEGLLAIRDCQVDIGDITIYILGTIKSELSNKNLNLIIHADKLSLKSMIDLVPEDYLKRIREIEPDGDLQFDGKIAGDFSGDLLPDIKFNFNLNNGEFTYRRPNFKIKNVSFKGSFDNGELKSNESFILMLWDFKAGLTAGNIEGEMTLSDFDNPRVSVKINSAINLEKLDEIIMIEDLLSITGNLKLDFQFSNTLKDLRNFTVKDFITSKTSGAMKLSGVTIRLKSDPVIYSGLDGSFKFNNKDLVVEYFSGKMGQSDFKMKGYFVNILAFAFSPGESIKVKADFTSSYLNMADLLSDKKDVSGARYRLRFSDRINFDLDLEVKKFTFGNFKAEDISGNVVLKDKKLIVSSTTLNTMEGLTTLSGVVDGNYPDKFRISFTTGLQNVNIQKMFYGLGDFGQQNITSDHLRGKLDATVYYKSFIDPELNIDAASVYALGDLSITEGELIRYTPLYKLSKYLKRRELEHIRFSTLKNQIEIKDQIVYIPEMYIESSTLNLKLNGTHTFGNIIDYHVGILVSDLLSKNDKKKEEDIDGIFSEEDGLGKATLYLSMKGNVDDPDIRYDTKAVTKKISSDLKKEKQTMKDAFRREFSGQNELTGTIGQDGLTGTGTNKKKDFKIEWEEDQPDVSDKIELPGQQKKQMQNPPGKKEFIIEWDEGNDTIK